MARRGAAVGLPVLRHRAQIQGTAELPAGTRILDLPTGGGLALKALRPDHGLDYVAADLSTEMLDRARTRAASQA